MQYQTNNEFNELLTTLKYRQKISLPKEKQEKLQLSVIKAPFDKLNRLPNLAVQQLAQTSFILFENEKGKDQAHTLLRHNVRKNISTLLFEKNTRTPELDNAEIFSGFIGSYPQTIFYVNHAQQADFIEQLTGVQDESSYALLLDKFGIRRTDPTFWQVSDKIHALHKENDNVEYGLFDYNRLENR